MKERAKQDKESATGALDTPERAEAEAGNPLCPNGGNDVTDKRARRYIRITDAESWELIDKIHYLVENAELNFAIQHRGSHDLKKH